MSREDLHFRLRIPEELKAKISAAAEGNRRSMTAEIIERLEQSFDPLISNVRSSPDKPLELVIAQTIASELEPWVRMFEEAMSKKGGSSPDKTQR